MAVLLVGKRKPSRGHCKPLPPVDLNTEQRLRVGHLVTHYNLSPSAVYDHLRKGLIPPADGEIAGRKYWRTATIKADLEK